MTPWSIISRAIIRATAAALIWGLLVILHLNPQFKSTWPFFWMFVTSGGIVGAILKWQLPNDWDR